ncbi:MAG: cytochrome c [Desulfuromonadaceae bacterium]|nr:cytochrome c [Desulfuromonadaceae bacterium]
MPPIRQVTLYLALFLCLSSTAEGSSKSAEIIPMLGCRACHQLNGKGGQLGPNLSGIGQRMTRRDLRQKLMAQNEANVERHMPSYHYLFESERQQLLDSLEQQ